MEHAHNIVKANAVIGVKVINAQKEDLGKIEEIMIDKSSGKVNYVVLSFGGFMGMGDKLFALPWHSIRYSSTEDSFILDVTKDKLKDAPGFDKDHYPNMAEQTWQTSINNYYGDMR